MQRNGITNVSALLGGYDKWKEIGGKVDVGLDMRKLSQ